VIDSQIVDNAHFGIFSERAAATRSTILGNSAGDECGVTLICADLGSGSEGKKPRLKESTCETSHRGGALTGETWGVCSLD
jgi:hypothetical protein